MMEPGCAARKSACAKDLTPKPDSEEHDAGEPDVKKHLPSSGYSSICWLCAGVV